jgi:hypothetical protein
MGRQRSNHRLFLVLLVVLAAVALMIGSLWGVGSPKVSLTFLEYKGRAWESTQYAELRLSNTTPNPFRYAQTLDGPIPPSPELFYREKKASGWSDTEIVPEYRGAVVSYRELKPGQSVTFLASVKPGALPKQVAIVREDSNLPKMDSFAGRLMVWLLRIRTTLRIQPPHNDVLYRAVYGIKSPLDGLVWCEKVLVLPKSGDKETTK